MSLIGKSIPASVVLTCASLLVFGTASVAAEEVDSLSSNSVESSFEDTLRAKATNSPEAAENLKRYESLSDAQQAKIETIVEDGTAAKELLEGKGSGVTQITESVPSFATQKSQNATPGAYSQAKLAYGVSGQYVVEQKVMGVTLTKFTQRFNWQVNNKKVTKTLSCVASAQNYNVAVALNDSTYHWASGGRGTCETVWRGSFLVKGFTVRVDKIQHYDVDGNGRFNKWLKNA